MWILLLATPAIAAVILYYLSGGVSYSRENRVLADIVSIRTQLGIYKERNGFYPTTEQGLSVLRAKPQSSPVPERWMQLFKDVPYDPWNNAYIYKLLGPPESGPIDLYSQGPDRVDSADDIRPAP